VPTIHCPTLIVGGDRDFFNPVENFVRTRSLIEGAHLAILPDCDHVGSLQRPMVLRDLVLPFVES
jgi:pimeloyl-ACP methyl ester carboxylesterase